MEPFACKETVQYCVFFCKCLQIPGESEEKRIFVQKPQKPFALKVLSSRGPVRPPLLNTGLAENLQVEERNVPFKC